MEGAAGEISGLRHQNERFSIDFRRYALPHAPRIMPSIVRDVQHLAGALLRAGVLDERHQAQRRPHRGEPGAACPFGALYVRSRALSVARAARNGGKSVPVPPACPPAPARPPHCRRRRLIRPHSRQKQHGDDEPRSGGNFGAEG